MSKLPANRLAQIRRFNIDRYSSEVAMRRHKLELFQHIDALTAENAQLALAMYSAGYQRGHHDTVEGQFMDDPHGKDAEYYHLETVRQIIKEMADDQTDG